jgi:hypothetical protein
VCCTFEPKCEIKKELLRIATHLERLFFFTIITEIQTTIAPRNAIKIGTKVLLIKENPLSIGDIFIVASLEKI